MCGNACDHVAIVDENCWDSVQQRNPNPIQQYEAGPIQSRSFRVLQKITDTDAVNDVGTEQIRKLELSEDERLLMNKFKEQGRIYYPCLSLF